MIPTAGKPLLTPDRQHRRHAPSNAATTTRQSASATASTNLTLCNMPTLPVFKAAILPIPQVSDYSLPGKTSLAVHQQSHNLPVIPPTNRQHCRLPTPSISKPPNHRQQGYRHRRLTVTTVKLRRPQPRGPGRNIVITRLTRRHAVP